MKTNVILEEKKENCMDISNQKRQALMKCELFNMMRVPFSILLYGIAL